MRASSGLGQLRALYGHSARVGSLAWSDHTLSTGSRDHTVMNHDGETALLTCPATELPVDHFFLGFYQTPAGLSIINSCSACHFVPTPVPILMHSSHPPARHVHPQRPRPGGLWFALVALRPPAGQWWERQLGVYLGCGIRVVLLPCRPPPAADRAHGSRESACLVPIPGPLPPLALMVRNVALTMDGCDWQSNLLASGGGSADGHIRFWNVNTGSCLNRLQTGSQVSGTGVPLLHIWY